MSTLRSKNTLTGHCANKQCEGTKPKSPGGSPMPVCLSWEWCKCKCHKDITKMYESVGLPREEPEQNPEFHAWAQAQRSLFKAPDDTFGDPSPVLSNSGGADVHPDDERAVVTPPAGAAGGVSAPPSAPAGPAFLPTPTGRRARGQLEYDVLQICQNFAGDVYEWEICTPKLVAEAIGKMNATEPPSTGAINAVWDRWEKLNFAKQDKKPSRFVGFVGSCSTNDLDRLKAQAKRAKRRDLAEARRGSLRPRKR